MDSTIPTCCFWARLIPPYVSVASIAVVILVHPGKSQSLDRYEALAIKFMILGVGSIFVVYTYHEPDDVLLPLSGRQCKPSIPAVSGRHPMRCLAGASSPGSTHVSLTNDVGEFPHGLLVGIYLLVVGDLPNSSVCWAAIICSPAFVLVTLLAWQLCCYRISDTSGSSTFSIGMCIRCVMTTGRDG
jgi:hypothetical protein